MKKIDGLSMDIEQAEREKLRSVFPECFTEGKLDIDKLLKAGYKNICEIGKEHIRRAGTKLLQQITSGEGRKDGSGYGMGLLGLEEYRKATGDIVLDTGFKVFKLDSSNLKLWDGTPVFGETLLSLAERMNGMIDRVKPERSDLDVVYEIMLKLGVPLICGVNKIDITGKAAYSIDNGRLLVCLAPGLTPEIIEQMADYAPAKIILAEHGLADDTAMANAHYILQDRNIDLNLV